MSCPPRSLSDSELDRLLASLDHLSPSSGFPERVMARVSPHSSFAPARSPLAASPFRARPFWAVGLAVSLYLLSPVGAGLLLLAVATGIWGPGAVFEAALAILSSLSSLLSGDLAFEGHLPAPDWLASLEPLWALLASPLFLVTYSILMAGSLVVLLSNLRSSHLSRT